MRLVHLLCAAGIVAAPALAQTSTGRCLLSVHGRTYLSGPCDITMTDRQGSFAVGVGKHRHARYFAYVTMEDDGAHGYWNETPDSSHAHASLGLMRRAGACWIGDAAKVCAYR